MTDVIIQRDDVTLTSIQDNEARLRIGNTFCSIEIYGYSGEEYLKFTCYDAIGNTLNTPVFIATTHSCPLCDALDHQGYNEEEVLKHLDWIHDIQVDSLAPVLKSIRKSQNPPPQND